MVKNGLPAIHPGAFLCEILDETGISKTEFAKAIMVSPTRIARIIKGSSPITAEIALLLGRAFNQSPQYWLNLQTDYDLKMTEMSIGSQLSNVPLLVQPQS
ncbi:MAG: HigA family addiction module antidote protein [Magnetococcales bacterium]|nr:HigA family addiction module antidote protein [Magnetococcales bacterium]